MNRPKTLMTIIGAIGLYAVTTAAAYAAFSYLNTGPGSFTSPLPTTAAGTLAINPEEPKDQQCPTNGQMFTKTEKAAWEQKRPALVMIENSPDARPQSGLSRADVIYEAVAEGGITRFMGVFYCGAQAALGKVAPVRSARMYFVNLATEYNTPVYVHVGGGNCGRDQATGECVSDKRAWALEELAAQDGHVCVVELRRNFGQTPALAAGFDHARGGIVLAMDGDLQHPLTIRVHQASKAALQKVEAASGRVEVIGS